MNLSPEVVNALFTAALVLGGALLHKFFPGVIPSKTPAVPQPSPSPSPQPDHPAPPVDLSGVLIDLLRQILARQSLAPQSFGDVVAPAPVPLAASPAPVGLYSVTIEGGVVAIRPV